MRRIAFAVCLSLAALAVASQDAEKEKKDKPAATPKDAAALKEGRDLPGAFHPFNITGAHKGRYHCLVSQHGLNPGVLVFIRDAKIEEPIADLLKKLDALVEKKPAASLGAFIVFAPPELKDAVTEDDTRDKAAKSAEDAVKVDPELKHVIAALAGSNDLAKYKLPEDATAVVVLFRKYRIEKMHVLAGDKVTPEAIAKIVADVELLIAPRK